MAVGGENKGGFVVDVGHPDQGHTTVVVGRSDIRFFQGEQGEPLRVEEKEDAVGEAGV
jgi:hypothetical protein